MLRALPVALCIFCVATAATFGGERHLSEFLPKPDDLSRLEGPHRYVTPEPEGDELDRAQVRERLNHLVEEISAFLSAEGRLPASLDDLIPAGGEGGWGGPTDPWGSPYELEPDGDDRFWVRSLGPDRERDTDDDLSARGP